MTIKLFEDIKVPTPFIKWAGGKSQLITSYAKFYPDDFNMYFEPFLGGGAVFFHLRPPVAVISDINPELINTYKMVRDKVEELIKSLEKHTNEIDYFYAQRALNPKTLSDVERASRFIFLNKTCYNGLYRVNKAGIFNVPFGKYKNPKICDTPNLRLASIYLRHTDIHNRDFEDTLKAAVKDDFVYLDPPYDPISITSKFTTYSEHGFLSSEQRRLSEIFIDLNERGCKLMMSNSDTKMIRNLYRDFKIDNIGARRAINCKSDKRGLINELVIRNY